MDGRKTITLPGTFADDRNTVSAPDSINFGTAVATLPVFHPKLSDLKTPALDDHLAATIAKCIFSAVARHVAGIDIF